MCVCLCVCWLLSWGAIAFVESKHHVININSMPKNYDRPERKARSGATAPLAPPQVHQCLSSGPEQYTSGYLLLRFSTVCKEGASEKQSTR